MWLTISWSIFNLLIWCLLQYLVVTINNLVLYIVFHYSMYCICYMLHSARWLTKNLPIILQTEACSICNTLNNETIYTKLNYLLLPRNIEAKNISKYWKLIKIWLTTFCPILLDSIQLNWKFAITNEKWIFFNVSFFKLYLFFISFHNM